MKIRTGAKTQGGALLLTLLTALVIGVTLASYLTLVSSQNVSTMRAMAWNSAVPVVEAGIDAALTHLHYAGVTNLCSQGWEPVVGGYGKTSALDDNSFYQVTIESVSPPVIYSVGYVPAPLSPVSQVGMILGQVVNPLSGESRAKYVRRKVRVTTTRQNPGRGGLIAKGRIIFSGGGSLDSFDSSNAQYSTNGKYDPAKRKDGGEALTNSNVPDAIHVDTAHIYGSVVTGPTGTVTVNSGAVGDAAWNASSSGVQSGHSANDANVDFPDVVLPSGSPATLFSGTYGVGGTNYTYAVGDGYSKLGSVNIGGGKSMIVTGKANLWIDGDFTTSGSGFVYIAPGASLNLYIKGKGTVSGSGIVNGNERASSLSVYGLNTSTTMTFSGSSTFYGVVYAPYAAFTFSGSAGACGSFTANSVTISGGAGVHYDEGLNAASGDYVVASWNEVDPNP